MVIYTTDVCVDIDVENILVLSFALHRELFSVC